MLTICKFQNQVLTKGGKGSIIYKLLLSEPLKSDSLRRTDLENDTENSKERRSFRQLISRVKRFLLEVWKGKANRERAGAGCWRSAGSVCDEGRA